MRHLEVLVVTEKTTTTKVLNWKVSTVNSIETAIERLQQRPFQIIAISDNFNEEEIAKLNQMISILQPEGILVKYNNNSSLSEKVKRAYWSINKPNAARQVLDNSFELKLASSILLN